MLSEVRVKGFVRWDAPPDSDPRVRRPAPPARPHLRPADLHKLLAVCAQSMRTACIPRFQPTGELLNPAAEFRAGGLLAKHVDLPGCTWRPELQAVLQYCEPC